MDVYAENILDHYRHPRGKRPVNGGRWSVTHAEENPTCGDAVTVGISVENGVIADIAWDGAGCAISQAAISMLAEELQGKTPEETERMTKTQMLETLGVSIGPRRAKCALLGLHAVKNALRKLRGTPPQSWLETTEVTEQ